MSGLGALERAERRRAADLKIERVRYYQREGILEDPQAKRFTLRIAREDLFGTPRPRGPRGPSPLLTPAPLAASWLRPACPLSAVFWSGRLGAPQ